MCSGEPRRWHAGQSSEFGEPIVADAGRTDSPAAGCRVPRKISRRRARAVGYDDGEGPDSPRRAEGPSGGHLARSVVSTGASQGSSPVLHPWAAAILSVSSIDHWRYRHQYIGKSVKLALGQGRFNRSWDPIPNQVSGWTRSAGRTPL
jgi:hypothetical protein